MEKVLLDSLRRDYTVLIGKRVKIELGGSLTAYGPVKRVGEVTIVLGHWTEVVVPLDKIMFVVVYDS